MARSLDCMRSWAVRCSSSIACWRKSLHCDGRRHFLCLDWLTPPIHEACADDRCRQLQQRFVDIQPSFKADSQLAKACKPAVRPLHHPPVLAQPLAALNASSGNPADDAPLPQVGSASLEVVAFVGVQLGWSFTGTP